MKKNDLRLYSELELTDKSIGASKALGCSVYKTKYDGIYLTDYDFIDNTDLKLKKQLCLFKSYNTYIMISYELLEDIHLFNTELNYFKEMCDKII